MRFPISPFQGTRSRPGNSLPNLMHFTIRVPGATGSADGAGLQLSSAIKVLRSSLNIHLTATPANCLEKRASKLFRFRVFSWTQSSIHKSSQPGGAMPNIDTLFWDIGGVVLTNGWDRAP